MAVLPSPKFHSSSSTHGMFLRSLLFALAIVMAPATQVVYANDQGEILENLDNLSIDENFVPESTDNFSINEDLVPKSDDDFWIQEDDEEKEEHSQASPTSDLPAGVDSNDISSAIPAEVIEPSPSVTYSINHTVISEEHDGKASVSETDTLFTITPTATSLTQQLDSETSSTHATETVTADDQPVIYQSHGVVNEVTSPEGDKAEKIKEITAPIVKFKVGTRVDKKTKRKTTVIRLEKNRLKLDSQGKRAVLLDASELPASYQSEAILQLSLRYRRHCEVNNESAYTVLESAPSSLASHLVTQESSVKPFSASRNLYLLQVDLCPQRAGQVFSLHFSKEKNIRSMFSKFGSVGSYIAAAQFVGMFAENRPGKVGPDGDNGGFADTLAAALPAGAIFNGVGYFREEVERWNLTGYDSDISACVTSALLSAGLNIGDSRFKSDTSQMFVSNAGRLYSRSAYFGELYNCFKHTVVDRVIYDQSHRYTENLPVTPVKSKKGQYQELLAGSHAVTEGYPEQMSSVTTSLFAVLVMYSYDFINEAELTAMEQKELQNYNLNKDDLLGENKLELASFGNEFRGGVASSAYKGLDAIHNHLIQVDNSWTGAFQRATVNLMIYITATYVLHYSRPFQRDTGPTLSQQVLGSRSILAANIMEAVTAYGFGQIDSHVSKPVANYLADGLVSWNLTVPDSYMHRGTKVAIRLAINAGASYKAINLINNAGEWYQNTGYFNSGTNTQTKNSRLFVDVITGTTTNGAVLPLVLSLDEDVFTPFFDGAGYYLCSPTGWGIGCPTKELQLELVVYKKGTVAEADINNKFTVGAD